VLGVAAVARIWQADLAQVGYDESAAASLIGAWRYDGQFPLTGIVSSVGIPNPPAWPYLMGLVLLPSATPQALVGLGIGVSLLSVVLTWWIARRWFGPWAGLGAATFYATAFWAVLLGRSPWQPAFLQVAVLMCLDALLILGVQRRPWALAVACGWLGMMVQLHYIAVGYVLLVPFAAWPARRHLRPVHVLGAVLAGVLPLVPFLVYELHPAVRLQDVGFLLGQATGGSRTDLDAARLLVTLVSAGGAAGLGGSNTEVLQSWLGRAPLLGWAGMALLVGGIVAGLLDGFRGRFVVAWLALPIAVLSRHSLDVLFHYLYLGLPAVALTVGMLGGWVARRGWLERAVFGGVLVIYAAVSLWMLTVVLRFIPEFDTRLGYGMPLRFSLAAGEAARAALPAGGRVSVVGPPFETEVVRFALGYDVPSRGADECADVLVVFSAANAPATDRPLLARVERPGDAYLIYGPSPTRAGC